MGVGEHILERSMPCSLGGRGDANLLVYRVEWGIDTLHLSWCVVMWEMQVPLILSWKDTSCEEIHAELTISSGGE